MDPPDARKHSAALLGAFMHKISSHEQDLVDSIEEFAGITTIEKILKKYPRKVSPTTGRLVIKNKGKDFLVLCYLSADNTTKLLYYNTDGIKDVVTSPYISDMCLLFVKEDSDVSWIENEIPDTLQLKRDDTFTTWLKEHKYMKKFDDELNKIHQEHTNKR